MHLILAVKYQKLKHTQPTAVLTDKSMFMDQILFCSLASNERFLSLA